MFMAKKDWNVEAVYRNALELMEMNLSTKMQGDEIYIHDEQDQQELENKYNSLRLTHHSKWIINDYHACTCSKMSRAIELAYLAGIEAVLDMISEPAVS